MFTCAVIVLLLVAFFFFKQKTAYEMRISDWSQTCALPISPPRAVWPALRYPPKCESEPKVVGGRMPPALRGRAHWPSLGCRISVLDSVHRLAMRRWIRLQHWFPIRIA